MKENWQQTDVRWSAVLASLLLSVFTLTFQRIPNADAYTYIRTAEIFLSEGIAAAYQHYSWGTYSILIGVVSWLGVDLFSAGLLLNAIFYAILVFSFVSIVREIDDRKPLLVISAICILVYPQLNEYRDLVIRDSAFWGLSVLAFWQYLLYARTRLSRHGFIYCAAMLLATAFRAEALSYLIFTPFALLLDTRIEPIARRKLFFRLLAIAVAMAVILLVFLALMGLDVAGLFIEFASVYEPFISGNYTLNEAERALLGSLLFNEYAATFSREYIEIFLLAGLIAILLANLFSAISGPYLIVLLIGLVKKRIRLQQYIAAPLLICLAINTLILLGFLIVTRYLSSRYAMLFSLLLVLFVPLIIFHIHTAIKESNRYMAHTVLAVFLGYCAIDSYFSFGEKKTYVSDSIEWLAENSAASSTLITNNHAIAYFSGKVEDYDQVKNNFAESDILSASAGATIAAELTFETRNLLAKESIARAVEFLVAFPNESNQRIAVYRRVDF